MRLSRLTGAVLAVAIGWVPVAPPEHVHESGDADHHHVVVHRHTLAHAGSHHATHHDGALDDDDDPVLTLSAAFTVPAGIRVPNAPVIEAIVTIEPPAVDTVHRPADYVELLIHGPPRAPTSLRAPPASFLL